MTITQATASPEIEAGNIGFRGATGPATTITPETVITLEPGSEAAVVMGGSAPAQTVTFSIPRGAKILQGTDAPGTPASLSAGNGDVYFRSNGGVYQVQSSAWVLLFNVTGPQGDQAELRYVVETETVQARTGDGAWADLFEVPSVGAVTALRDEVATLKSDTTTIKDAAVTAKDGAVTAKNAAEAAAASIDPSGLVQIGQIVGAYASPGVNWLPLDGSAYAQATYADLYAILGDIWPYDITGTITGGDVNPTGPAYGRFDVLSDFSYVVVCHSTSPYVTFYDWNAGSPTKLTNPATLPTGNGRDVVFSPDDAFLAVGHETTPFVTFYDMATPSAPVKKANPATLPPAMCYGVSWTPDSRYCMTAAYAGSNCLTLYDFNSGSPVKVAGQPATQPAGPGWTCRYSPDGNWLAVGNGSSPFITIYDNTTPAAPVKIADPAVLPTTIVKILEWSPDSRYIYCIENGLGEVLYDMNSGVPVSVPFDVAPAGNQGVSWISNTEFYVLATTYELYEIIGGTAVLQSSETSTTLGLMASANALMFSPTGGFVLVTSSNSPYFGVRAALFDPLTHFKVPLFTYENQTYNTSQDAPTAYIKGL